MTILVARKKENNERVSIFEYKDEMKGTLICEEGHELIAKRGAKKKFHFAHKRKEDDDCICNREKGTWHCWHQARIQKEYIEIIYPGRKHIADCKNKDGLVIEFQKSIVPEATIVEREQYYKNMIWVFCADQHDFETTEQFKDLVLLRLVKGSKYFLAAKKPTYLDWTNKKQMLKILGRKKNYLLGQYVDIEEFDSCYLQEILNPNPDKKETKLDYCYEKTTNAEQENKLKEWKCEKW